MKSGNQRLVVQLGKGWRQFTQPLPGLAMLGTVLRGLEIGALARTADGRYLQVNGSVVREWPAHRVEPAIQRARRWLAEHSQHPPSALPKPEGPGCAPGVDSASRASPVVTYRRRRTVHANPQATEQA